MARDIKTREKVKGIKTLDRAALTGQRMKDTYVRTKDQAGHLTEDNQGTGTDYAQNQIQYVAEDAAYGAGHAAAAGARLAANKTKEAIRERKEIKTAEQYRSAQSMNTSQPVTHTGSTQASAPQSSTHSAVHTSAPTMPASQNAQMPRRRRPVRQVNLRHTMEQRKLPENNRHDGGLPAQSSLEPGTPAYRSPQVRSAIQKRGGGTGPRSTSENAVERGRQLAISKAKQSAEERQKIKQRERYAPKARDVRPQTRDYPGREYTPTVQSIRSPANERATESMAHRAVKKQDRRLSKVRRGELANRSRTERIRSTKQSTPGNASRQEAYTPTYRTTSRPFRATSAQTASRSVEMPAKSGSKLKRVRAAEQTVKSKAKTIGRDTIKTASRSIKTTGRTMKTAEQTSTAAVTTVQQSAIATKKAAAASAQAAKKAAAAAKFAAEKATQAAKAAAKATAQAIKAIIAAMEELISTLIAGGWAVAAIVIVICLIGLIVGSSFGIFFSSEDTGNGQTMRDVVREINNEYNSRIEEIKAANPHDELEMSGTKAVWKEVLAVYAVKTNTDPDAPQEVVTITDEKKQLLKNIFWEMNVIDYHTETVTTTETVQTEDGEGNPIEEEIETSTTTLYITVNGKTSDDMTTEYNFSAEQIDQLHELLSSEYDSLWTAVLYGIGASDEGIVNVALSQLGNVGGRPYWSWYGFSSRVSWCACFVSWCANECGYIDAGIIPKFSWCDSGIDWFRARGEWAGNDVEPSPGWIIFFDWDLDGYSDHVGIVEYCEGGYVHTIEGNTSGDMCKQNVYAVGESDVMGYGMPAY